MIRIAAKLSRATSSAVRSARLVPSSHTPCLLCPSPPFRLLHDGTNGPDANPVAIQMINYALSHARSQKSGSSLIHFYLYFKISQTFFIFLFFMLKKKNLLFLYFVHFVEESYGQGLLVLEQCLSTQLSEGQDAENSRGLVLLAMSTLCSERFFFFSSFIYFSLVVNWYIHEYIVIVWIWWFQREFWWSNWETSGNWRIKAILFRC